MNKATLVLLMCLGISIYTGWNLYRAVFRGIIIIGRAQRKVKTSDYPRFYRNQLILMAIILGLAALGAVSTLIWPSAYNAHSN